MVPHAPRGVRLALGLVGPVVLGPLQAGSCQGYGGQEAKVSAGLDQEDRHVRIFRQARGHHAARSSRANFKGGGGAVTLINIIINTHKAVSGRKKFRKLLATSST